MTGKKGGSDAPSPTRPYLLRAIHKWAVDNGLTPQVLVDADCDGVQAPMNYVQDGTIVLNIHPRAVKGLEMDNDHIFFSTRFGGQPFEIFAPMDAVLAVFARENGQGIFFETEEGGGKPDGPDAAGKDGDRESGGKAESGSKSSHLKLVK
ncbi:MAG: ClpXP protease specificity-enhancing factor [Pseudomonadota bacterium]|nr:ClpXP protease specificity-enhancing factor [Pseudomonadota bacterium]